MRSPIDRDACRAARPDCRPPLSSSPRQEKGADVRPALLALMLLAGQQSIPLTSPFQGGVPSGTATSDPIALSIGDARAAAHDLAAARLSYQSARELVVLVAANVYLQALAAAARADSARAQVETAQALYTQAVDLKQSGLIAGIDLLRAQVQLNTEQQRATATRNDFEKAKLQLARVIGLPIGQAFTLSDQIPYAPVPEITIEQALERAYKGRPDYQAALERVQAAEASRASARATA